MPDKAPGQVTRHVDKKDTGCRAVDDQGTRLLPGPIQIRFDYPDLVGEHIGLDLLLFGHVYPVANGELAKLRFKPLDTGRDKGVLGLYQRLALEHPGIGLGNQAQNHTVVSGAQLGVVGGGR